EADQRRVADEERQKATAAQREAESQLYYNRLALAYNEWQAHNVFRADQLLAECLPAERRGWEWHYLHRLCHGERLTLSDTPGPVYAVAFSPDGKRLASPA